MPQLIEIKARSNQHKAIRAILQAKQADFRGIDHQIDTYFVVPAGRLKLRQGNIENTLIYYQRANQAGPKLSEVKLYHPSPPTEALHDLLSTALGQKVVVDKSREIYFIDNVKFHLDTVANLGTFLEIEAIDDDGSIGQARLHEQCSHYIELFGVQPTDLITHSYSDMLLERSNTATE